MPSPDAIPSAGENRPGSMRPLRPAAVIETAVFLLAALAIDQFFLGGHRFRSAPEHPFWIPVLLVSAQYGTGAGLLAALASSIALLAGNIPGQGPSQDRFAWMFEIMRLPLLWFLGAVTLGELRMRHIRRHEAAEREARQAAGREKVLAEAYQRLNRVKEALETRVASQLRTAVGLYDAARAMEKLDPAEVLVGVGNLIRSLVNPQKFSLFLLRDGGLWLALEEGWSADDPFPRTYSAATTLFREVIGRQRTLSVAAPEDMPALQGAGMIAVPVAAPDSGRVLGMLKIEELGFLEFNFSNVQTLKVLCQWIAAAYENALRYQTARADRVVNAETELFTYGFLSRQLSLLTLLAQRIGFDLTMIVVRLENPAELTGEQLAGVAPALRRAVSMTLRKSDLAFDYQRTGTEFALVLPATPPSGAQVVIDKLGEALESGLYAEAPQARFSFGLQAIHETGRQAPRNQELQHA